MRRPIPSQRVRVAWLILYAIAIVIANHLVLETWLPPIAGEGLWFYTAALTLLLGDLVVHPYYVSPKDTLAVATPAVVAAWFVLQGYPESSTLLVPAVLIFCLLMAVVAVCAMLWTAASGSKGEFIDRLLREITRTVGHPKVVLSSIFLLALVEFHVSSPTESLLVGGTWAILIGVQPERPLYWSWQRLRAGPEAATDFGSVAGYQTPNVLLVRNEARDDASLGTLLVCNDSAGPSRLAVALDYTGRDEELLLRCLEPAFPEKSAVSLEDFSRALGPDRVGRIAPEQLSSDLEEKVPILNRKEDFLGIVDENTDVERLYFEVIRERDLEEGHLVEVNIRGHTVLYQVVNGMTKEEIVHRKHTYGYARAEATKIGVWNVKEKRFVRAKWLPKINAPVFKARELESGTDIDTVGHFPGSDYPVGISSVNDMVTHNTAILGILGIGKSMLAIELVERMLADDIKVVCLDLTNQYATELTDWHDREADEKSLTKIQAAGEKDRDEFADNPEEGGSFPNLKAAIKEDLRQFMRSENTKLKILNPSHFAATRQEAEPRSFKNDSGEWQRGAPLWSVTPVEVTQVVAESLLSLVQDEMSDMARVCLVLEEAHSLVPEWNNVAQDADRNATNGTARAILQGRKYGFGCLLVTQRTANVTKTILNQCNTVFAMRTFDDTGKAFLANYLGANYADVLPTLSEREAVFFGKASTCENPVRIRLNDRDDFLATFREIHEPPKQDEVPEGAGAVGEAEEGAAT